MTKELLDLTLPQYHLGTENNLITPKITVDIIVIFSMYSTYMCTCLYVLLVCSFLTRWKYRFSMVQMTGYTSSTCSTGYSQVMHKTGVHQVTGNRFYKLHTL